MNSYLLETEDLITREHIVKDIIEKENFQDANVSIYDLEDNRIENALEDLDTYGLLSNKKIIIIRNIENISEDQKDDLEHLYRYMENPNPDNLLIIECKKLNHTTKLAKELQNRCKIIEGNLSAKLFIKELLKGYKYNPEVINLIEEYSLGDMTRIENECNKLKNYRSNEKTITTEDVKELVVKKLDDPKDLTFSFTRSLALKEKKEAIKKYKELLTYQLDPLSIIGLLGSQIRIIYQVMILAKKKLSDSEIAKQLEEKSEYRIKKTRELIPYYTEDELRNLMQKLSEIDYKIKTTDSDQESEIENFILNI